MKQTNSNKNWKGFRNLTLESKTLFAYSFTILLAWIAVPVCAQGDNYIRTTTIKVSGISESTDPLTLPNDQKNESTSYYDGLGRPKQSVIRRGSPNQYDLVTPMNYDGFGRQAKSYLPYEASQSSGSYRSSAISEQVTDYINRFGSTDGSKAFSETLFESSLMSRTLEQGAPGADWQPGTASTKYTYSANSSVDRVKNYTYDDLQVSAESLYPQRSLIKTETIDPDGNWMADFTTKRGLTVLKRSFVPSSTLHENLVGNQTSASWNVTGTNDYLATFAIDVPANTTTAYLELYGTSDSDYLEILATAGKNYVSLFLPNEGGTINLDVSYSGASGTISDFRLYEGTTADTYYIYDDFDRLKVVLPPESNRSVAERFDEIDGYTVISSNQNIPSGSGKYAYTFESTVTIPDGVTLTDGAHITAIEVLDPDFLDKWAFQYEYDGRGRMISKQVPGADPVYMVYDARDRLVLTQDGEQRKTNKWLFTKYDGLNRPIVTGIMSGGSETTERGNVENEGGAESYNGSGTTKYTTNNAYPTSGIDQYLTVTYYDEYGFNGGMSYARPSELNSTSAYHILPSAISDVKGQITGTLTEDGNGGFLETVTYYDNKYRPIQVVSENHMGGTDVISNQYDFVGNIRRTHTDHDGGAFGENVEILKNYTYDHQFRLLTVTHKINSEPTVTILENDYNDIGELTKKNLHYAGSQPQPVEGDFEQNLNYDYNIRGWLRSINDSNLSDPKDLFGMELYYNTNPLNTSNKHYNGNISAMYTSNHDFGAEGVDRRAYDFTYDALNRLTNANHYHNTSTATTSYDVDIPSYDLNGNIQSLTRKGKNGSNMDNLLYTYEGNRLQKVDDSGDGSEGFAESGSGTDYTYDANGNMISDANKGITDIDYNHLNLPTKVTFDASNYIEYQYDAAGIKLQQQVVEGGTTVKTTDYAGEFIYENKHQGAGTELQLIQHEEGRIIPLDPSHPEFIAGSKEHDYQYHLKDHLGNVRLTFNTTPEAYSETATYEDSNATQESQFFGNYDPRVSHPAGGKGIQLNNGTPAGTYVVLSIDKGDQVDLSVQGYFNGGSGYASPIAASVLEDALSQAVQGANALEGLSTTVIDNGIGAAIAAMGVGGSSNDAIPGAYLTYMIFDREMTFQNIYGYTQIPSSANGSEQPMTIPTINVDRQGYLIAYLSNESNSPNFVFFDDFNVAHTKTNIVSTQDYYPFGLTFNEYERTASTAQNFKFQGQEHQPELGWDQFRWRNSDPALGRFTTIDPLSEKFYYNSPYAFSENKVTGHIELEGLESVRATNPRSLNNIRRAFRKRFGKRSSGGNPTTIRDAARDAASIANSPVSFYTGPRQKAMFERLTTVNVGRGTGNSNNGSNNPASGSFSNFDNTHSFGNTPGNLIKVAVDITDFARTKIFEAGSITKVESFTEFEGHSFSLGFDVQVGDFATTLLLIELEGKHNDAVTQAARGSLSQEEFDGLDMGEQARRLFKAPMDAGPSPLDLIRKLLNESSSEDSTDKQSSNRSVPRFESNN